MANSDIQQMLGIISQKENQRRHKVAAKKKKQRAITEAVSPRSSSSSGSSGTSSHKKSSSSPKKKKKDDGGFLHDVFGGNAPLSGLVSHIPGVRDAIDFISRPLYGSSAGVESLQKSEYALDRKYGTHRNFFEKLADEVQDPGIFARAGKEWMKGIKGEKKQTFSHNLAYAAKHDPDQNDFQKWVTHNKWAREGTGFLFDIGLDPTTYIGMGVVTKPYHFAKNVTTEGDLALAKQLEGLGLKSGGVDRPISAKEYLDMMGKIDVRRVTRGASRAERRRYIRQNTLEGKNAYANAADDIKRTRRNIENLGKVKQELVKRVPHSPESEAARAYAAETSRIFDEAINKAGLDHLQAGVAKWDSKQEAKSIGDAVSGAAPPVGKAYIGGEFSDMLDEAMHVSELTKLVNEYGRYRSAKNILETGPKHKNFARATSENWLGNAESNMQEIISKWTYGDAEVGAAEVGKILDQMHHLSEAYPGVKSLKAQAGKAGREAASAKSDFERSIHKGREKHNYARADRAKAIILKRLLAHKASGTDISSLVEDTMNPRNAGRLKELDDRLTSLRSRVSKESDPKARRDLQNEIDSLESEYQKTTTTRKERLAQIEERKREIKAQLNAATKGNVKSTGEDVVEPGKLRTELSNLEKERNGILVDAINNAEETSRVHPPQEVLDAIEAGANSEDVYRSVMAGEITGEWADLLKQHVEERAVSHRHTAVETKIRRRREMVADVLKGKPNLRNMPDEIQSMFKQEGDGPIVPKVEIEGTEITLKDKAELKKYETQADRDRAASANKTSEELHPGGKYTVTMDEPKTTPKKGTKKAKGNDKTTESIVNPVTHPVYQYTFERLFQREHGMSYQAAIDKMQKQTGDYVTLGGIAGKGEKISKSQFVDWARQHPGAIGPNGFGLRIKIDGETHTYAQYLEEAQANNISIKDARNEWEATVREWMRDTPTAEVNKDLQGIYFSKWKKQSLERKKNRLNEFNVGVPKQEVDKMTDAQMMEYLDNNDFTGHFSNREVVKMQTEGTQQAIKDLNDQWSGTGDFSLSSVVGDKAYILPASRNPESDLDHLKDTFLEMLDDNYRQAQLKGKDEVALAADKEGAAAKVQNDLQRMYNAKEEARAKFLQLTEEARQTQEALVKRLQEYMLISAAAKAERKGVNTLRFTFAGNKILPDIPTPDFLYKMTEAISNLPLINKTSELWAKSFNPASKLTPELNKARLRSQSHTPELIKQHMRELHHTFGGIKPNARRNAFVTYRRTGNTTDPVAKKIESEFNAMLPYIDGSMMIGDKYLTAWEVNKYLPAEFKMIHPKVGESINKFRFTSGHDIAKRMTQMGQNPDPMKALWSLRVAVEKAQADIALKNVIRDTFGVKRGFSGSMQDRDLLVEQLQEGHGWTTVSQHIGTDYLFDPQTAGEINKLFDLMKPGREEDILQIYDKALHFWKGMVTVYNPGYYTRNGIGEVIMGMFDGLTNPKYYKNATKVMARHRPDATKEALKQLDPWLALKDNPANEGARIAARMRSGHNLTVDEAEVLFSYSGLKSGFVSTEYDHLFPRAGSARATSAGKSLTYANDKIRSAGEKYEDYFRMAHFLYRMEKAPRALKLEEAADWAATYVRKYHFDYTDFTPHEKAVWMRIFPFYKWTRKAMPLMASMYFTRPGKVLLYPKAMNAVSGATSGSDPLQDASGVMPDYNLEKVVPQWMKNLMAYPIGTDDEGNRDYVRLATPTMDVYSQFGDPVGSALSMFTPIGKTAFEQSTGQTMEHGDFQYPLRDAGARWDRILGQTPITNLLNKAYKDNKKSKAGKPSDDPIREPGAPMDEVLFSWLTGLGTYENNKQRQEIEKRFGGK